jgi:acyl-CoA synthetase (AMP-forming)/AMP-acid ligase II
MSNGHDLRLQDPWRRLTLTGLLGNAAQSRGRRLAVVDAPDAARWAGRPARAWSVADLAAASQRLARQWAALGLRRGEPVLVVLPNQVDMAAGLLGSMLAGLVPVPLPVIASAAEMSTAAAATGARAILTTTAFADSAPALTARDAALGGGGLRAVAAYGSAAPEGVVALDDWPEAELDMAAPLPPAQPTDIALITLAMREGVPQPHARTHAQLVADALALAGTAGITNTSSLVVTTAAVSACGVLVSLAAPLLAGATVHLHGPFDSGVLDAQMGAVPDAIVVMPLLAEAAIRAHLGPRLHEAVIVDRSGAASPPLAPVGTLRRLTDLTGFGEAAVLVQRRAREGGLPRYPRRYRHPAPAVLTDNEPLLAFETGTDGLLQLSGFGVAGGLTSGSVSLVALDDGPAHVRLVAPAPAQAAMSAA